MKMDILMASKYRGCLLGALLGDCLGAPYEGESLVSKVVLQQYFDKLGGPYFKAPVKMYTDDTAMTKCLLNNILSNRGVEPRDLAKRFTVEYFNEPRRGYGQNVIDVFHKLRAEKFEDPFGPARAQFNGSGSYGNGGAMRIAPIALFYYKSLSDVIENAKVSTKVTHTNKKGVDGAVLQAVAICQSLQSNPEGKLNPQEFSDKLFNVMASVEKDEEGLGLDDPTPYQAQLRVVKDLLEKGDAASDEEVQMKLGTSVAALYSVPTAIFCFLRARTNIPEIETDNPFRRTLQYAISLGGDTDTIASMAGAIAGAFYGDSFIPENLKKHCESSQEISDLADSLYDLTKKA
ncbi:Putative adp-ribosylglycohydrolase posttranslational modification [Gryllus bimaculatus]|nr:Putative adp-ribosylglycohydrolase posttranslational modification [Gryllus bimaculatus]